MEVYQMKREDLPLYASDQDQSVLASADKLLLLERAFVEDQSGFE
jgi:hypothetical protein